MEFVQWMNYQDQTERLIELYHIRSTPHAQVLLIPHLEVMGGLASQAEPIPVWNAFSITLATSL